VPADGHQQGRADVRLAEVGQPGVPQLVTVRWLGMFLEDPLAVPRSRFWPATTSPGYRPVSLGSWADRWLPASR
jgi:hypothetical protein